MGQTGERIPLDPELDQLARTVIAGFDDAARAYYRLSGGWEVYRAPEYYCTIKVAEKLAEPGRTYVTLEQNIADALNWSGRSEQSPRTDDLPDHGRFDIAV